MAARSSIRLLVTSWLVTASRGSDAVWYQGLANVAVLGPSDDVQAFADEAYKTSATSQFSATRKAVLLKTGDYGGTRFPVGYYTSVTGVGVSPDNVTLAEVFTLDNPDVGNACDNFWRAVEGLTMTASNVTWAASQAAPLRRLHVRGDLFLSEVGPPHWSSGGFISDSVVDGTLHAGTQQQYLFRSTQVGAWDAGAGKNFVFVGVVGPDDPVASDGAKHTFVDNAPIAALKPYLVEDANNWKIVVPPRVLDSNGPLSPAGSKWVDINDVFVAKEGDDAASITLGIVGKKGLLLTPAIYNIAFPIIIEQDDFVVLGIGFPTLVATQGNAALIVDGDRVRVAHVLLEAGTPLALSNHTAAMLIWNGVEGVLSDIFTRVGAFSYATGFKASCEVTRADVHVQLDGDETLVDNTWFWHADHDDCGLKSDQCYSGHGLLVNGRGVTVFGLKSEHTMRNLVEWHGTDGQVFLFQSELPYHYPDFERFGGNGYYVNATVARHAAFGVGVYIVGGLHMATAIRVPSTAQMTNMLAWTITADSSQFASVVCTTDIADNCYGQGSCSGNTCYLEALPPPSPSSAAIVI